MPPKPATSSTAATTAEPATGEATEAPKRRGRKPAEPVAEGTADLIAAIKWIDVVQRNELNVPLYETHSLVTQGWIIATDGTLTAGHRIGLDGYFSPHTVKLLAALNKIGPGLSIAYSDNRLVIQSKGFRVAVPCVPGETVPVVFPAGMDWACDDRLGAAIEAVIPVIKASAKTVLETSIMLTEGFTALATDRTIFLEAYHAVAMPPMCLPLAAAKLMKGKKGLTAMA